MHEQVGDVRQICFIRQFFNAFHAIPRLALVPLQVRCELEDHCGLLLVFFMVLAGFMSNGIVLFGCDVQELATLLRGSILCVQQGLGDIDFDHLSSGRHIVAEILLMTFLVVCAPWLTDILMAVVIDSRL